MGGIAGAGEPESLVQNQEPNSPQRNQLGRRGLGGPQSCGPQRGPVPAPWAAAPGEPGRAVGAEAVSPGAARGRGHPWGAGAGSGAPIPLGLRKPAASSPDRAAGVRGSDGRRVPVRPGSPPPLPATRPGLPELLPGGERASGRRNILPRSALGPRRPAGSRFSTGL